ncbi:protein FAM219A-like [Lethenteron reissneri]|uniref:protein FAM219A-like n=1 Tax=Lethenteron reissneri TaxID=7753 RepID=UPI002AB67B9E|nr:protein FAM219A-like [Lethenteron reissneri]
MAMEEAARLEEPGLAVETSESDSSDASSTDSGRDVADGATTTSSPATLGTAADKQRDREREGARRGEGSPVSQQPKKGARTRLGAPSKGYASLEQRPDEKPPGGHRPPTGADLLLPARTRAHQINQDLNRQLLKDGYRLDEVPDDEDLDLIPPKPMSPACVCCQLASPSTTCNVQ